MGAHRPESLRIQRQEGLQAQNGVSEKGLKRLNADE